MSTMKTTLFAASACLLAAPALAQDRNDAFYGGPPEVPQFEPAFEGQWRAPILDSEVTVETTTVVEGLEQPWAIAELPDGSLLVTEQAGRMRVVGTDGSLSEPIAGVPQVFYRDQGGLLDVELTPNFAESREIVFSYSEPAGGNENTTAVARARLSEDRTALEDVEVIFRKAPAWNSTKHFGSRIAFEDEDTFFVGLGERSNPAPRQLAQNIDSHIGTVVRINLDGSVPQDNPFVDTEGALPEIWSYGHRNIQSAALNPETGALWTIEHGPQGGDEVNVPKAGLNYGWPTITYGENYGGGLMGEGITQMEGLEQPVYYWSPVIAPSGMAFYQGDMFPEWQGDILVGALRSQALVRLQIDGERVTGEERLVQGLGRVRAVEVSRDGSILLATDARNGSIVRLTAASS